MCILTKLIIVCRVCCGNQNSKNVFFAHSGKQSNSVWTMLRSFPYILVIGHVLTVAVIGLVWKLVGGIQKHRLFLQTLPSLFPFALIFSLERLTSF